MGYCRFLFLLPSGVILFVPCPTVDEMAEWKHIAGLHRAKLRRPAARASAPPGCHSTEDFKATAEEDPQFLMCSGLKTEQGLCSAVCNGLWTQECVRARGGSLAASTVSPCPDFSVAPARKALT